MVFINKFITIDSSQPQLANVIALTGLRTRPHEALGARLGSPEHVHSTYGARYCTPYSAQFHR